MFCFDWLSSPIIRIIHPLSLELLPPEVRMYPTRYGLDQKNSPGKPSWEPKREAARTWCSHVDPWGCHDFFEKFAPPSTQLHIEMSDPTLIAWLWKHFHAFERLKQHVCCSKPQCSLGIIIIQPLMGWFLPFLDMMLPYNFLSCFHRKLGIEGYIGTRNPLDGKVISNVHVP